MVIEAINAPLWMAVQATGKIRNYQIMVAILIFLNLPLSYMLLKLGLPVYSVWYIRIFVNIIVMVARWGYMQRNMSFPILSYTKEVIRPIFLVSMFSIPIPFFLNLQIHSFYANLITVGVSSLIITLLAIYTFGMSNVERLEVKRVLKSKLHL
jgi:hypothetical protein